VVDKISRMKLKVCFVGERAVGKSSLINRYMRNVFSHEYRGTLGAHLNIVKIQEAVTPDHLVEAEVALFDLMGERGLRDAFRDVLFWGTHGFVAVADVARPETIRSLPSWVRTVQAVAGEIPFRIVMNKVDMLRNGAVTPEDTAWLLSTFPGVPFSLTSARTGEGIENAIHGLIEVMIEVALARSTAKRATKIVGQKILMFAQRRGATGISNKELLTAIRGSDPNLVMEEVEDLHRLGFITMEVSGPGSFRIKVTQKGEEEIKESQHTERIVEVPT